MRILLLISLTLVLGSLGGCINSNTESKKLEVIQVPCEIYNENGIIGCGKIPISLKEEVNKLLSPHCNSNFDNFNAATKRCLEENKKRVSDAYFLGNFTYYGKHFIKNEDTGLKLIKFSADNQNPEANLWLSEYYAKNDNIQQSIKYLKIASDLGSPLAMHNLGARYSRGLGVEKNIEKSLLLLNQSKKYIAASYSEIALIDLINGDVDSFVKNNNIAAENKYWFALADLAVLYLGEMPGFEDYLDLEKADELANKLISHDVITGDFIKARVLKYKSDKNPEVCKLYKKSFENGYLPAGINLGAEYLKGNYCEKDYHQALNINLVLFKVGNNDIKIVSASNLGFIYLNGLGVPKDIVRSKMYLKYAVEYGYQPAQDMLKNLK